MLPFLLPLVTAAVGAAAATGAAAAAGATATAGATAAADATAAARRRTLLLGGAAGAIAVGVIIYTAAAATFPHWPDRYRSPLYEVTFRLLADGLAAPSLGSWLGLPGAVAALPCFALAAGLLGWAIVRAGGWRALTIASAVATVIVGSYGWLPRTPGGEAAYQRVIRPAVTAGAAAGTPR
jgi:hypothetical protein